MEAKSILRKWNSENTEPKIVSTAAEQGRQVVFTPPNFSDLLQIALLWAQVKNNVAQQYFKFIILGDVRSRIEHEF